MDVSDIFPDLFDHEPDWEFLFGLIESFEGRLPPHLKDYLRQLRLPSRKRPKRGQPKVAETPWKLKRDIFVTVWVLGLERKGASRDKAKTDAAKEFGMSKRQVQRAVAKHRQTAEYEA
jgi:hypothetical protein